MIPHSDEMDTHDFIVEPGPYPPGEGPLDYAHCAYGCNDWFALCAAHWPQTGWTEVRPDDNVFDEEPCSYCRKVRLGWREFERKTDHGAKITHVWSAYWVNPTVADVYLCEECVILTEDGDLQEKL